MGDKVKKIKGKVGRRKGKGRWKGGKSEGRGLATI